MLLLILTDRNEIGIHDKNIGRHQNGICEKPVRRIKSSRYFIFIAVAALKKTHRSQTRQIPGQFLNFRHIALTINDSLLDI